MGEAEEIRWPLKEAYTRLLGCKYWPWPLLKGWIPCVVADTLIFGDNLPIQNIEPKMLVLGYDGFEYPVRRVFFREYSGPLIKIRVMMVPDPILITPEHPILIKSGDNILWKRACELKAGDLLVVPRRRFCDEAKIPVGYRKGLKVRWVNVDKNVAYFLGLYLAEGCVVYYSQGRARITLNFGRRERDLVERCLEIIRHVIGINAFISEEKTSLRIHINNTKLGRFLREKFGHGAINKHIPRFVKNLPYEELREFVRGFMDGDGTYVRLKGRKSGRYQMRTSSRRLAYDLVEVLIKLGICPYVQRCLARSSRIGDRIIRHNTKYWYNIQVQENAWLGRKPKHGKISYEVTRNYIYVPIKSVEKTEHMRVGVWNLETDSETYCLPFVVHNCRFPLLKMAGRAPCDLCHRKYIYEALLRVKGAK